MRKIQTVGIDHVEVFVKDVKKSEAWYSGTLGFERRFKREWGADFVVLGAGMSWILLSQYKDGSKNPPRQHFAFQADITNFNFSRRELDRLKVPYTEEDHHVSHSIYFADPDGHRVEITTYR